MSVDAMLDALVGREGGYVNHPADRGGPTRWGITEQVARAYGYKGDMRSLPRETALEIYRKRYWTGPKFDQVAKRYPRVGEELLDTGVNMGQAVAAKFLQRALNVLNRGAIDYPDITVDGALGNMTLAALDGYKAKRGVRGEAVLLKALDAQQGCRYLDIAEKSVSQETFVYGWFEHRVGALA
jgi:lysozyme family protein